VSSPQITLIHSYSRMCYSGLAFFITCFYKREELLLRVGIYVSAASMAGAFGGLLATGYASTWL
jgi:hypothetical protein